MEKSDKSFIETLSIIGYLVMIIGSISGLLIINFLGIIDTSSGTTINGQVLSNGVLIIILSLGLGMIILSLRKVISKLSK